MGIAWFRWLIVRGRSVAPRPLVRSQSVPSPCMCGAVVRRKSVSARFPSVGESVLSPSSVRWKPVRWIEWGDGS